MKFSLRTAILLTTVLAIQLGSIGVVVRNFGVGFEHIALWLLTDAPLFIPLILLAYAAGRRRLTVRMVALLVAVQIVAFGVSEFSFRRLAGLL